LQLPLEFIFILHQRRKNTVYLAKNRPLNFASHRRGNEKAKNVISTHIYSRHIVFIRRVVHCLQHVGSAGYTERQTQSRS